MRLSDLVRDGYSRKHDLNCAETILFGADEVYGLGLGRDALRLAAGFGRGMGIEDTCGALTGAVMVLSRLFAVNRGHDSPRLKELCVELFGAYRREMGEIKCTPLMDRYRTEEHGCREVILKSAEILEGIIARETAGPQAPGSPSRP